MRLAGYALVALAILVAAPIVRYGTLQPCEMLRRELVASLEGRFGPFGGFAAGVLPDDAFAGLPPERCIEGLVRLWTRGPEGFAPEPRG